MALVGVVFVPLYVKYIGIESYGLVAFYGTLVGSLTILDMGLSTAVSRQIAILNTQDGKEQEMRNLFLSVELIYWSVAIIIGVLIIFFAEPIAIHWINSKDLSIASIKNAVMLMGVMFAFQWPMSFYNGVMIGLERQVANALITISLSIIKAVGVIAILHFVSATVESYFIWQTVSTLAFILLVQVVARKALPGKGLAMKFSARSLKSIWKFTAGMAGISIITFFLSQVDKIVVSKIVLLEYVGYYTLAFTVASLLTQIISPLQPVVFPRFSALVAKSDTQGIKELYHRSCRWVSIIVIPTGLGMIVFAKDILLLWTHDLVLAEKTYVVLQFFAIGSVCNALMWMPYFYMLAKGITKFSFYQNLIAAIVLVPLLFWWTNRYGIEGASLVWLCVNAGYIFISIPLIHSWYMKGELMRWYKDDFLSIAIVAGCMVGLVKLASYYLFNDILTFWRFAILISIAAVLYSFLIRETRAWVVGLLRKHMISDRKYS